MNCRTPGHRPQDPVGAQFFRDVSSGLLVFEAGKTAPRGPFQDFKMGLISAFVRGNLRRPFRIVFYKVFCLHFTMSWTPPAPNLKPNIKSYRKLRYILHFDVVLHRNLQCFVVPPGASKGVVLVNGFIVCICVCLSDFIHLMSVWCLLYDVSSRAVSCSVMLSYIVLCCCCCCFWSCSCW